MLKKWSGQLVGLMLAASLVGGCVTASEVKSIVQDANRESMVAGLAGGGSGLEPENGPAQPSSWKDQVARIEDFILTHPEQVRTNNALRLREAVLLLNAGQPNLARAVFSEIDREHLAGARDRAIYDAREDLIWWYGLGRSLSPEDRSSARAALTGLAAVADGPDPIPSYTRRFLEQTRVRIANRLAASLSAEEDIRSILDEATARYAEQFDASDRKAIQAWHTDGDLAVKAGLKSLRWYDYVPTAFARADEIIRGACRDACTTYTPDWVSCIKDRSCR